MNMPFDKNSHVSIIKEIAFGLYRANFLKRYLELGVRKGVCFNLVARFAKKAYAVDVDDCYKYIKNNENLIWYHGTTVDFFKNHDKSKKFDLVFIDADHNHESSLSDFTSVLPIVNSNGLIFLHDTYPTSEELINPHYCGDTYKTAECIRKDFSDICEIVTLPFYFGISIVRKLDRQLLWMK